MFFFYFDFEQNVYDALNCLLGEGETISCDVSPDSEDKISTMSGSTKFTVVDFYLKEGCKRLEMPPGTYIEAKRKLTYSAFEHIRLILDKLDKKSSFYVVTESRKPYTANHAQLFSNAERIKFITLTEITDNLSEDEKKKIFDNVDTNTIHSAEGLSFKKTKKTSVCKESPNLTPIEIAAGEFSNGNVTLVLGAGVSASASLPDWSSLLKGLLRDANQQPLSEEDYPAICTAAYRSSIITARYLLAPLASQDDKIVNLLHDELYKDYQGKSSDLIRTIADMCNVRRDGSNRNVRSIITLNYDDLIEEELKKRKIPYQSVFNDGKYGSELPVIHVHGIIKHENPEPVVPVLSEESYHNLYRRGNSWANIELLHAFYRHTCIFIGLSMSDPNIRRLLENAQEESSNHEIRHYAILPWRQLTDYNWDSHEPHKYYQKNPNKEEAFKRRQEEVFGKLGVRVIWYDDGKFDQIPAILRKIASLNMPVPAVK